MLAHHQGMIKVGIVQGSTVNVNVNVKCHYQREKKMANKYLYTCIFEMGFFPPLAVILVY